MKIEVGKYYKSRDGQKVGPMYSFSNHAETVRTLYADVDDAARAFYIDSGKRRYEGGVGDLIAEWIDGPVTGTLHELNVQVGDVVQRVNIDCGIVEYTIGLISGDRYYECYDYENELLTSEVWRIISRASQPCPVITETVTTQRIVPGVYGRVSVAGTSQSSVELEFVGEYGPTGRSRLNSAELTAAIATITQIRDALTHNSAK